jgi:hypothetical protein
LVEEVGRGQERGMHDTEGKKALRT